MSDYRHLAEVDHHPELLHPFLLAFWRRAGATLRYQPKGDLTLFVSPILSEAIPVYWDGEQYLPATLHNGKVIPLTLTNRDKGLREQAVLTQGFERIRTKKGS